MIASMPQRTCDNKTPHGYHLWYDEAEDWDFACWGRTTNMNEVMGTEILRVVAGSRAYGLNDENSDTDHHGVFVQPTADVVRLFARPRTTWQVGVNDAGDPDMRWELKHFLEGASKGNPTMLETFFAPVEYATLIGHDLLALGPSILNRKGIYDGYKGYAGNQRAKMFEPEPEMAAKFGKEVRQRKAAISYIRSLYQGSMLLENGWYSTQIADSSVRDMCVLLRAGLADLGAAIKMALFWEGYLDKAYENSRVQTTPDYDKLDRFLLRVRQEIWQ